ncbi:hypothetical protein [Asticcacaulis sp.]|uniref:hypothetical protein n=1 Tax=Asticcacaulis sp. TaxID=1872648 RepID=UPI002627E1B2|nr:hypothetical protein [Asticcacaulis sp.]
MPSSIFETQDNFYLPKDTKQRYRMLLRKMTLARGRLVSKKAMYTFLVEKFLEDDALRSEFVGWFERWRENEER